MSATRWIDLTPIQVLLLVLLSWVTLLGLIFASLFGTVGY